MKTLPGLSKWKTYGGSFTHHKSDVSSYSSYDIETEFGKYSIHPVGTSSGRMVGYSVYKYIESGGPPYDYNNVDLTGNVHYASSPTIGVRIAQKDFKARLKRKKEGKPTRDYLRDED